jgi:HlyD family secretion protein
MKRNRRTTSIEFLLLALVFSTLTGCSLLKRQAGEQILVSGNLELTEVNIAFKTPGKLIELMIEEGDQVTKGMVLARLDPEPLLQQRSRDQATLALAESQLTQQKTSIEYQKATLEADIDGRRAGLHQAAAKLDQLLAGSRKQEIKSAEAVAAEAHTQHALAREDWDRAQTLYKSDDISTAQRDQYKTRFDASAAALRQAEEQLALVIEGPRKEDIEAARAQVDQAGAALRLSEAARLELKRKEQELEARRAQVDQARAQLAITDTQLRDLVASSPVNGTILVKSAEAGEIVAAGTVVAVVGDMDKPWLRGYVNETDLGRVKLGDKVKVTTDSYPGKEYWGRVTFISSQAEFTPKQIQTHEERVKLVYRIKIEVDNPRQELKLNMPADAEILLNP